MNLRRMLLYLSLGVFLLAFTGFALLAFFGDPASLVTPTDFILLIFGLGIAVFVASRQMTKSTVQYVEAFHDVSTEDAEEFVFWQSGGQAMVDDEDSTRNARFRMPKLLRVQSGKVDMDGPALIHKVGGPGYLSVDHDSAVVTSRKGRLNRVLGPGFHDLLSFERPWNVIDLRPQRRTLTISFMTRDGIPASCQVSIVCRVAAKGSRRGPLGNGSGSEPSYPYAEEAVFKLSTSAYVRSLEGPNRVSDWTIGMANGALDGAVRDVLEQYRLDEFLNPQHWLDEEEDGPPRIHSKPKLHTKLESEIEAMVRATGRQRGVIVERVELGVVRPDEKAISRQWLDFWQAKLQKRIDLYTLGVRTGHARLAEFALVDAQVAFINRILEQIQELKREDQPMIPPELFITSVVDVLTGMVNHGPEFQRMSFHQIESLRRIVDVMQGDAAELTVQYDRPARPQLTVTHDATDDDAADEAADDVVDKDVS